MCLVGIVMTRHWQGPQANWNEHQLFSRTAVHFLWSVAAAVYDSSGWVVQWTRAFHANSGGSRILQRWDFAALFNRWPVLLTPFFAPFQVYTCAHARTCYLHQDCTPVVTFCPRPPLCRTIFIVVVTGEKVYRSMQLYSPTLADQNK